MCGCQAHHVSRFSSQSIFGPAISFCQFHSTETALLSVHNDLVRAADGNQVTILVMLDLSVRRSIRWTIMFCCQCSPVDSKVNVSGKVYEWFQSYLTGRTQTFTYDDKDSCIYDVDCNVPQGGVCSEDLKTSPPFAIVSAAVQTTYRKGALLVNCSSMLNADKTEVMWFWSKCNLQKLGNHDLHVNVASEIIQPVKVMRNQGVQLDEERTMKHHVNNVAAVCFFHLRRLSQLKRRLGRELMVQLVMSFIRTRLVYCSIFAGLPKSTLEPLQRVLRNSAAR